MAIFELLDEKSVKINLESTTKQDVLEELVDLLVDSGKIQDKHAVLDAIEDREAQVSIITAGLDAALKDRVAKNVIIIGRGQVTILCFWISVFIAAVILVEDVPGIVRFDPAIGGGIDSIIEFKIILDQS